MKKNAFVATSLLYSFFFVFAMLMISNLAVDIHRDRLVRALKNDIKETIEVNDNYVNTNVENKTYNVGEVFSFAREEWKVIQNRPNELVAVLNRSLTKSEITKSLQYGSASNAYYGDCDDVLCNVRACKFSTTGVDACFLYNSEIYSNYSWKPSSTSSNYYNSIIYLVVERWFSTHNELQIAKSRNLLSEMTINDGVFSNYKSYVRIPMKDEVNSSWAFSNSFHTLTVGTAPTKVYIYNGSSIQSVDSSTAALIYPVITVKKISA